MRKDVDERTHQPRLVGRAVSASPPLPSLFPLPRFPRPRTCAPRGRVAVAPIPRPPVEPRRGQCQPPPVTASRRPAQLTGAAALR